MGNRVRSLIVLTGLGALVLVLAWSGSAAAHSGQVIWQRHRSPVSFVFLPTTPRLASVTIPAGVGFRVDDAAVAGWTSTRHGDDVVLSGAPATGTTTIELHITAEPLGHLVVPYRLAFDDGTVEVHTGQTAFHFTVLDNAKRLAGATPPAALALSTDGGGGGDAWRTSPAAVAAAGFAGVVVVAALRRSRNAGVTFDAELSHSAASNRPTPGRS